MPDDFDAALDAILAGTAAPATVDVAAAEAPAPDAATPEAAAPEAAATTEPEPEPATVTKRRTRKGAAMSTAADPEDEYLTAVRADFPDLGEATLIELAMGRRRLAERAALAQG